MTCRSSIATHEAGHAVVSAMHGFVPVRAFLYSARGRHSGQFTQSIPPTIPIYSRSWGVLQTAIAGHMAELLCGYARAVDFTDWFFEQRPCVQCTRFTKNNDQSLARMQAKFLSGLGEEFDDGVMRSYVDIVEQDVRAKLTSPAPWAAMHLIADELRRHGEINQAEFYKIFDRTKFSTRHLLPN